MGLDRFHLVQRSLVHWLVKMSFLSRLQHFSLMQFVLAAAVFCQSSMMDTRELHAGTELQKETLPLKGGSCLYQLNGLKSNMWYEIPASFSLQLQTGSSDLGQHMGRRLLNTEKLIFKTELMDSLKVQKKLYVLVNVVPEGIVAIPGVEERKYATFNIACDELLIGIPHKAWCVVIFVLLCLAFAFVIPSFLPPHILPGNQNSHEGKQVVSKDS
ncbi:OLC1v1005942C1 [Oldenlandia corymbosa var. corymbosa]|uniref:OLC1v1005942C1 n=1 Tax=Oldenlandia corymbosa var. corymbosa TaxID=529605 RepID=A0AAV1DIG9_OLDCO|nr:OLC1v1005942C1 [Oldenlandia corymbosa var. corymbosa]